MDITSRVELSISCTNLVNLDILSKSDPQVIVYMRESTPSTQSQSQPQQQQRTISEHWTEIGRTEIIWDNLNPKFVKSLIVNYRFEASQNMRFVVVDIDNEKSTFVEDQDLIGEMQCTLGEIVGTKGSRISRQLALPRNPNKIRGFIHVRAEEVEGINDQVDFRFSATGLDKKDWFGKSDPFLVISRANEDGEYQPVHKSEYIKKKLSCIWSPFVLTVQKLCNGDHLRPIRLEVYDYNKSGKHKFIGHTNSSLEDLLKAGSGATFDLINPKKKKKKGAKYKNSGILKLEKIELRKVASFLDYIRGGYDINLMVAIDFTASNGDPRQSNSLHYMNPSAPNDYQKAIRSVGDILSCYDSDKKYPVYGFGARIPPQYHVSHCFPTNLNWQNPEVYGVDGIMQAYNYALTHVTLHGPTNFSPIINTAATAAKRDAASSYYILLIITDGEICDMDNTIHEIVQASTLPLSIIIVGVGNADFSKMDVLDADESRLESRGKKQARDTVQFVPFRNFRNCHPSLLAEEVLREVPDQFLSYMTQNNIKPKAPIRVDSFAGGLPTDDPSNHTRRPSLSPQHMQYSQQQQQQPPPQYGGYAPPYQQMPPHQHMPNQPPPYPMHPPPHQQQFNPNLAQQYSQQQQHPPPQYPPQQYSQHQQHPQQYSSQQYNQQPLDMNQMQLEPNAQSRWKTAGYAVMFANQMSGITTQQPQKPLPPLPPKDAVGPIAYQEQSQRTSSLSVDYLPNTSQATEPTSPRIPSYKI